MDRDDIIKMAREAGFNPVSYTGANLELFERFATLVAAAERERLKQSIRHSLTIGPKTIQTRVYFGEVEVSMVQMPIEEVVAAEREACEKACKQIGQHGIITQCVNAIRARGKK